MFFPFPHNPGGNAFHPRIEIVGTIGIKHGVDVLWKGGKRE
jgi:hypothetical protein